MIAAAGPDLHPATPAREKGQHVSSQDERLPARMTPGEILLLCSFLECASDYLEFGAGGSTVLAAERVKYDVWCVDSSLEWLEKVQRAGDRVGKKISCRHVDVGPLGMWGYPLDHALRSKFPDYYTKVWGDVVPGDLDFVLVDGRFRIACFCEATLRVRTDACIGFHDYRSRPDYHCVEEVARMIAMTDDLAIFVPKRHKADAARALIKKFAYNPL